MLRLAKEVGEGAWDSGCPEADGRSQCPLCILRSSAVSFSVCLLPLSPGDLKERGGGGPACRGLLGRTGCEVKGPALAQVVDSLGCHCEGRRQLISMFSHLRLKLLRRGKFGPLFP